MQRYDAVTRCLHWLQAALILGLVALGWWMVGLTYYDRWYYDSLFWHRAIGMLTLAVFVFQFAWRFIRTSPSPVVTGWEQYAATLTHCALLLLMLLTPVTGYLISTSAGAPIPLPAGAKIPALIAVDDNLRDTAVTAHYYLAYLFATLIAVHIAAAVKHHFIDKNDVLRRML